MLKICLPVMSCFMVALAGPAFAQAQPIRVGGLTCDAGPQSWIDPRLAAKSTMRFQVECNGTAVQL